MGFANLPNQVYRKSVKRGFEFTLMVVGEYFFFWHISVDLRNALRELCSVRPQCVAGIVWTVVALYGAQCLDLLLLYMFTPCAHLDFIQTFWLLDCIRDALS